SVAVQTFRPAVLERYTATLTVSTKVDKEHDLILIVVSERTLANVDQDLQSDRKTEYSLAIDQFIRVTDGKNISPASGPFPGVEAEAELKTQGKGKVKRNDRLEARVQARVVEVLPNGNLRLEARRERRVGDETTVITLSGVAPGRWIALDDTVPSDRLADLKISYSGEGPVSARTGSSWLCTVLDWIWPF
ncbi:MAG: flagellar basal body L-ring protein FlgH, partial [Planctomycetota bacterium]